MAVTLLPLFLIIELYDIGLMNPCPSTNTSIEERTHALTCTGPNKYHCFCGPNGEAMEVCAVPKFFETGVLVPRLFESVDATSCPTDRLTGEERAWNFTCVDNSYVYHCILDDTDRLVETCASRVPVPEGKPGCPVVRLRNGVAYHLNENSECPLTNPACPSGKSAYYSDQLYLYPVCFLNESERRNNGRTTTGTSFGYEYSTEKTTCKCKKTIQHCTNVAGVAILILLLLPSLVFNAVVLYKYCRKKESQPKERSDTQDKESQPEERPLTQEPNGHLPQE